MKTIVTSALLAFSLFQLTGFARAEFREPSHALEAERVLIRKATMIDGVGTPAEGPVDIYLRGNRIDRIVSSPRETPEAEPGTVLIDAEGKYVLPGFINMHGHVHSSWGSIPAPAEYIYKLWLACGITTVRDVGSDASFTLKEREKSAENSIIAPRLFIYAWFPGGDLERVLPDAESLSEESLRREVRAIKKRGADGMKIRHFDRETVAVIMDEARRQELRVAHHVGVEDFNAWDNAAAGTTTIEHWYGIPDAALLRTQQFPADFNHLNELHRFRYAGRIWRETDPDKLLDVLTALVDSGVAWDPTFAIYEASRDLQRAVTKPWFDEYLHPGLAKFFEPSPESHGSFFMGWTNTDEVYWKENYRIWMDAVRRFEELGGIVTTGEDAGYIYQIYGFCYLRELQLHEEAGFHPIEVIRHATENSARVLGQGHQLGRVKPGYLADLIIVDGNPLENLKTLMPRGADSTLDFQRQGRGGIDWTIKDGVLYRPERLLADVRAIVQSAKAENK